MHGCLQPHLSDAIAHLVEADARADDEEARVGRHREHRAGRLEEYVVPLRAAHVGDEAHQGGARRQLELVTHALARHRAVEPRRVDACGDRHHALRRDARRDHERANGLAAGDDPIGEPVDEGAPPADRNRHVSAPHDGPTERPRRDPAKPAVDGAVGVDQAHVPRAHEAPQTEEGADVCRAAHANRDRWDCRRPCLGEKRAARLANDQGAPAVVQEPARLRKSADFLAPVPVGGLGVQDGGQGSAYRPGCSMRVKGV